ncbi:lipoprotein N-acyltransferase Lnb domain-containing protein [Gaetbulibacter saemankumensis]|uniref:lipoprotein N-acyltransferase Lnb domain-containing protein n=1 Tax=Gaetbulibacter saemankumensis TaxID=311208 RepID=UPI0004043B09|nr:DUF4105 domain-containing protein [Gaetbulibacter saemankumensis]
MKKLTALFVLLFISQITFSQNPQLSEAAQISVLTIGPGTSLNDAFGHSAFRIKDPIKGNDLVFNYGVYDFNTPNFYLKFAQGRLHYLIGLNYYEDFFESYIAQNRSIKEQFLNLTLEEKQTLYHYLLNNLKPENRAYLYDFFYDNCATKIKDVAQLSLDNNIKFNIPENYQEATFRTLIQNNLSSNSWGSLGIDIALGAVIDKKSTPEEQMFLPENIYKFFKYATLKSNNQALVTSERTLYEKRDIPSPTNFFSSPFFIIGLISLGILLLTYNDYKKQKRTNWLDVSLFSITGFIGIFILLLWFATDHKGTHQNYNLLWAFALNILVIGEFFKKKAGRWFRNYLKLLVILLCLLTLHWIMGVQVFALALIPFLVALLVRYWYLLRYFKTQ